jgi:hypothetical protein
MGNILGGLLGVAISIGLFVVSQRFFGANASADAPWRKDAPPRQAKVGFLFVMFGGAGLLFFGIREYQQIQDRRHPPVEEHRDELLRAASQALGCGDDRVTVQPQEPTLARVEGCGQSRMLRWGPVSKMEKRLPGNAPYWHAIDPDCRFEFLGFSVRCQ